jgi:AcrR family transcriptional regulator
MTKGQETGRANQKARTRTAIVDAAEALRAENGVPTVAEAADAARVSRATAYRYFPTQEALQVELDSSRVNAPIEKIVASFTSNNAGLRVAALIDAYCDLALGEEAHMRTALRVYQDTWLRGGDNVAAPQVRKGRRMKWLTAALAPLPDLPPAKLARLRAALALCVGADSLVILKDVVGLDHSEANAVLKWVASALLRAGPDDA